jgi:small-conductance mechanosensitive channel
MDMEWMNHLLITREWIEAISLLLVSLLSIGILKRFLIRTQKHGARHVVAQLLPYILNLGYVVALRIFLDAAPLRPRLALWTEHLTYVLTVWLFLVLVRSAFMLGVEWSTRRAGSSDTLKQGFIPLLRNLVTLFIFIMGGIMILKHFNYDVMSLLTALGVGSLAVGLAAKEALSNMISGFVLIMDRNLRMGDRISLGGITGDVSEIGLRSTRILVGDGTTLIVPNFDLVNNRILNLTDPSRAVSCSTIIRVPYSADFQSIQLICLSIIKDGLKVDQSKGKWVNLARVADGFQEINVGWWLIDLDDQGDSLTDFHQKLLAKLKAAGISLIEAPLPPIKT